MQEPEDISVETIHTENDELTRRLRGLQWPSASTEVRERCWDAFNARLAKRLGPGDKDPRPRRNAASRLEYRRRAVALNIPPAQITSGRRAWAARPTRRVTAFVA
ncbi:MAG: hypothetical protein QOJ29_3624 [Thermoleophilaceae bacterium]|jgi:hypothetical protein|nr:hypothetical protein [Thermoleophilaceae bacterium]